MTHNEKLDLVCRNLTLFEQLILGIFLGLSFGCLIVALILLISLLL